MLALTFGDRPSGSIAILALRKTAEMLKKDYPEVWKLINKNCYLDDLLHSVANREAAEKLMKDTEKVLEHGGFQVKHWICSSVSGIVDSAPKGHVELNILKPESQRVLGMVWNPETDEFHFQIDIKISWILDSNSITLRQLVSLLVGIYDPPGFLIPYIIEGNC